MHKPTTARQGASELGSRLLERELNRVVAERVKQERRRLGLTLQDVAGRAGLSLGMISKIENAQTSPSLRTLAHLSRALDLPLAAFFRGFQETSNASYVRSGEGAEQVREGTRYGHRYELLASAKGAHRHIHPFLVTLTDKSEAFPMFQHPGVEFVYALEGSLTFRHGPHIYELGVGDSLMFDGRVPHGPEQLLTLPIRYLKIMIELEPDDGHLLSPPPQSARSYLDPD